jgi:hypothetical protein
MATNIVIPRWLLIGGELVLVVVASSVLVVLRRQRRGPGLGVAAGAACYALALAVTIGLEKLLAGDHPAPWLHGPLRAELAELLVLAGTFGWLTRVLARRGAWKGEQRYLALAAALELAFGVGWLLVGAPELAWIWLLPAASLALARVRPLAILAAVLVLVPVALVLAPAQLREAAWNGFLPIGLPLAVWVGVLGAPMFAFTGWWFQRHTLGPLGSLVRILGCTLAAISGVALLATARPACSSQEFRDFRLACEQVRTWPSDLHYRSLTPNQSGVR